MFTYDVIQFVLDLQNGLAVHHRIVGAGVRPAQVEVRTRAKTAISVEYAHSKGVPDFGHIHAFDAHTRH